MLYVIHCIDKAGKVEERLAHYEAHKAYLAKAPVKSLISGPLLADDNETMIGSLFIVDAPSISEVRRFNELDPFHLAGIWGAVHIHPFNKRVDNRS